ncbi:MAG TPA: oligosaccharide flippase family protein [Candidatus Acidoferrales bacterium]|nr:oligosaccharide flippase family protein [Candidatus Acidoferrales bacterium]
MSHTKDVIKGISLIGFLRFSTKGIGFLETIILARILAPSQFGAYGIALLTLGLLEVITETGVNIVLVQEKEIEDFISSAWIVSIARGIVITFALYFSSPFIAGFFHSPQALILLQFMSIVPLLRGFINPAVVKLQKNLQFGKDFSYRFTVLVVDTVTSVIVTYLTKNPIGIVVGLLSGVIVEVILSFAVISPRPWLSFKKEYIKKIFHGGKWITFGGIFDYLFENADNIVVGRLLGASSLGIYQLAYSLAVMPLTEVGKVFQYVGMPILVKISDDMFHLRNEFSKSIFISLTLTIPFVLIIILFPGLFVWLLGNKWSGIEIVLPFLAGVGLLRALTGTSSALFYSMKKQKIPMITTFITSLGLVLLIIPLVSLYGIVGAAIAALISSVIALPFTGIFVWKELRTKKYE